MHNVFSSVIERTHSIGQHVNSTIAQLDRRTIAMTTAALVLLGWQIWLTQSLVSLPSNSETSRYETSAQEAMTQLSNEESNAQDETYIQSQRAQAAAQALGFGIGYAADDERAFYFVSTAGHAITQPPADVAPSEPTEHQIAVMQRIKGRLDKGGLISLALPDAANDEPAFGVVQIYTTGRDGWSGQYRCSLQAYNQVSGLRLAMIEYPYSHEQGCGDVDLLNLAGSSPLDIVVRRGSEALHFRVLNARLVHTRALNSSSRTAKG